MNALLERLRGHWLAQNIASSGGASEEEVAAFEREHKVALPPLFREYVRELNGMADASGDSDWVYFWPLSRMRRLCDLNYAGGEELSHYWAFADYLMASHDYAILLSPDLRAPAPVCVMYVWQAAPSFEDFLRRYLEGDEELIYLVGH